jgi:subtilisin
MKNRWLLTRAAIAAIIVLGFLPSCSSVRSTLASPLVDLRPSGDFQTADVIDNSYIVVLRDDLISASSVGELTTFSTDVKITHQYENALHGFSAEMTAAEASKLQKDPRVASVVPDRKIYELGTEMDLSIDRVNAELNPRAHIDGVDSPRVDIDVAIIDGGVGPSSMIDIEGGKNCTSSPNFNDEDGHGTFVAGLVAGFDNSTGRPGVAPGARIWSVKVLSDGQGTWSDFICGADWVTSKAGTIEVANISLGGPYPYNEPGCSSSPMHAAICRMVNAGVTVVVAAGNSGTSAYNTIPARYSEVITVSAFVDTDGKPGGLGPATKYGADDHFASFSNDGPAVDIAAPGVNVCSILPFSPYHGCGSGTSFAAPLVTGAAAAYIAEHGRVGPNAVRLALNANRDPAHLPGDTDGDDEGVLNASGHSFATLGLSRTSAQVDQSLSVTLKGFAPNEHVAIKLDSTTCASVKVAANGEGLVTFKVPALTKGKHTVSAVSSNYLLKKSISISPRVRISPASGVPGSGFDISLRGFAKYQRVTLILANGASKITIGSVTTSGTGSANLDAVIPSIPGGSHAVTAVPATGGSVSTTLTINPSVRLSRTSGASGTSATLDLKGFASGETVKVYFLNGTTRKLLRTKTVSASGSARSVVTIPITAAVGKQSISAVGSLGSRATTNFSVTSTTASIKTTPTPSPTATQSPTPSPVPPTAESPTSTPETVATATPTEAPTESPTDVATSTPTETPTEIPTETPTEVPTETPTPEATVAPTDTPVIEDTATPTP